MKSLEYIQSLRKLLIDGISTAGSIEQHILELLEDHATDLAAVFDELKATSEARQKVQSGKVTLDEQECEINKEFIDETLRLSDALELNELSSAELLYEGSQSAARYDRSPFDCAVYLHHAKRQTLLDTVRLIIEHAVDETSSDTHEGIQALVDSIMAKDPKQFASRCLKSMQQCRDSLDKMVAAQKRDTLVGSSLISDDASTIRIALLQEHQTIALILCNMCRLCPQHSDFVTALLKLLKVQEQWSDLVSHQIIIVMKNIQTLAVLEELQPTSELVSAVSTAFRSWLSILVVKEDDKWQCVAIQSILQLLLATELNGLCKEFDDISGSFDYDMDILAVVRSANEHLALQHMITAVMFAASDVEVDHPFRVFFTESALTHYQPHTEGIDNTLVSNTLNDSIRLFIQSFIVNLADELKELRLQQEDAILAAEHDETSTAPEPSNHVELFCGVIYTVYKDRPDLTREFWDDKDSDLYGFIAWASHAQSASSIYSFFTMLGVLSAGSYGAAGASEFLDSDSPMQDAVHMRPAPSVTWPFIFDSLKYYVRSLDRSQAPTSYQDPLEIDSQNTLILKSYLFQICSTIRYLPTPDILEVYKRHDCLTIFFQLLSCRLPPELHIELLETMAAFARNKEIQLRIWPLLEQWLHTIDVNSHSYFLASVGARRKQVIVRPLLCLQTFTSIGPGVAIAMVDLLTALIIDPMSGALPFPENLGDSSRHSGIEDYTDYVFDTLQKTQKADDLDVLQRIKLSQACLHYIARSLSSFDIGLVNLVRAGSEQVDKLIATSSLRQYLVLHPGTRALQRLMAASNQSVLFQTLQNHNVADVIIRKKLEGPVSLVLNIIDLALRKNSIFSEFVLPQLPSNTSYGLTPLDAAMSDNTDVLVQIVILCVSSSEEVALHANQLLSFILKTSTSQARTRLMAALVSVDQSKAILHGFIDLIENSEAVKSTRIVILETILHDLTSSRTTASVAHLFLGFAISSPLSISAGSESGQIGSGTSLFHSMVSLIAPENGEATIVHSLHDFDIDTLRVTSLMAQIIAEAVENPLTSSIALDTLRTEEAVSRLLSCEATINEFDSSGLTPEYDDSIYLFLARRAAVQTIAAKNLLDLHIRESTAAFKDALRLQTTPRITGILQRSSVLLSDFLDVLSCDLIVPEPQRKWLIYDSKEYLPFVDFNDKDSAAVVKLALDLRYSQLPATSEAAAIELRNVGAVEKELIYRYVQQVLAIGATRIRLVSCLQSWSALAALSLQFMANEIPTDVSLLANDLLQKLFIKLPALQDSEVETANTVTESISLIMSRSCIRTHPREIHGFCYREALTAIQNPASTYVQREHLYMVCIEYLDALFGLPDNSESLKKAASTAKIGSDRLLTILTQDMTFSSELLKISACVLMDLLARACSQVNAYWFYTTFQRSNLLKRFYDHFSQTVANGRHSDNENEDFDRQFDLVLRLSMDKECVRELVSRTTILQQLMTSPDLNLDGKTPYRHD